MSGKSGRDDRRGKPGRRGGRGKAGRGDGDGDRVEPPRPEAFAELAERLGGVEPLDAKPRVRPVTRRDRRPAPRRRTPAFVHPDPDEPRLGVRADVGRDVLDRLAAGDPAPGSQIDLHGLDRERAERVLGNAIETAARTGVRVLRVVHGRGARSADGVGVLREALPGWLTRSPLAERVLAFAPDRSHAGGDGVTHVLVAAPR